MCPCTPFVLFVVSRSVLLDCGGRGVYHLIHRLLRLMNHCSPSLLVQHFQIPVRNYAEYFNNNVVIYIEPGHLWGVVRKWYGRSSRIRGRRQTSQSIHTSGWLVLNSAMIRWLSSFFRVMGLIITQVERAAKVPSPISNPDASYQARDFRYNWEASMISIDHVIQLLFPGGLSSGYD